MSFWKDYQFYPVVDFQGPYEVLDFSQGPKKSAQRSSFFSVGKFNEKRPSMYTSKQFDNARHIHMGIDLGAPEGTAVHSFYEGEILYIQNNDLHGDYGPSLVTRHELVDGHVYALYGHLSLESLSHCQRGQRLQTGEVIAWIGGSSVNGGWPPHVHFQLSWEDPGQANMPGVVCQEDRERALKLYIDPRRVLGPLY